MQRHTLTQTSVYNKVRANNYVQSFTDNPASAANFLQPWQPSQADLRRQRAIATAAATYATDGKVQVIPPSGSIILAGPPSWPPIPPAYTPRPGTLVPIPWQESFQPPSAPSSQMADRVPVVKLSGRIQRQWNWSNPGVIDNRGLDDSLDPKVTTDVANTPYRGQSGRIPKVGPISR